MMDHRKFAEAFNRLPRPISCFEDGAVCPWCGELHRTVTFGENFCDDCRHGFLFGYPEWHEGDDPVSYVNFPFREWEQLGRKTDVLAEWKPNNRLLDLYHRKAEEKLGVYAAQFPTQ